MKTTWIAGLVALLAAFPAFADEDPPEYKDRIEARDAYRRGYERGFERGYQRGLEEGEKRSASRPPPPPPPVVLGPIRVTRAEYGNSSRTCNATRFVKRAANGRRSHSFKVTNEMCGDPAHGARKTLEVTYYCGQVLKTASAREHQDIYLNCATP
jgi:hypothetical protein